MTPKHPEAKRGKVAASEIQVLKRDGRGYVEWICLTCKGTPRFTSHGEATALRNQARHIRGKTHIRKFLGYSTAPAPQPIAEEGTREERKRTVEVRAYAVVCADGKSAQRYKTKMDALAGKARADVVNCGPHRVVPLVGTFTPKAKPPAPPTSGLDEATKVMTILDALDERDKALERVREMEAENARLREEVKFYEEFKG